MTLIIFQPPWFQTIPAFKTALSGSQKTVVKHMPRAGSQQMAEVALNTVLIQRSDLKLASWLGAHT
jgi:hypothetical protein